MRNEYATRKQRQYVGKSCFISFAQKEINAEEKRRAADKSADERYSAVKRKAARGVFDIVVNSLIKRGGEKAEHYRAYSVVKKKINESAFDVFLFGENKQHDKAT